MHIGIAGIGRMGSNIGARLMEMGGTLTVRSLVGQGSTFWCTIQLDQDNGMGQLRPAHAA